MRFFFGRFSKMVSCAILCCVAAGTGVYACHNSKVLDAVRNAPPEIQSREIGKHLEFLLRRVRVGMTKEQVMKILGAPHNLDTAHVWAWSSRADTSGPASDSWVDFMRFGYGTWYIVFIDGKTVGYPQCIRPFSAENPQEVLMGVWHCDEATALAVLGVRRDVIEKYLAEKEHL